MAITGISSYDGKQIIAAGAQSATKAYQDSNGDVITSKYQTTAGMSNYIKNTDTNISVGFENTASNWSFGQGEQNDAVAFSFAQGNQNTALTISFAQGSANYARGDSFAQGSGCKADQKSIAQGADCSAIDSAQAFGVGVVARTGMMAIGSYNNKTAYASFVIGNGTANDARSDIFYIDKNGNVSAAGKISANGVELGPGGGGGYTGNVQEALDEVYSNSGNWNSVYNHVSTASASWTGGGGAGVVTATGGDETYVTSINEKPISATNAGSAVSATNAYNLTNTAIKVASATSATNAKTATYASNGIALTSTYNSARSGYAASAYLNANVTGNITRWNTVYTAYTANSAQWLRPTWNGYDYYSLGVNYITANYVGSAGFRFNPSNLFTTCSLIQWTYSEVPISSNILAIRFGATMNNVLGTQWTVHNGVFTLSKGNFMEINEFACGDGWNNSQIILLHDNSWSNSVNAILRDIRNSTTGDNTTFILYYTGMVGT